ncbi:MAG: T9SS type A sorting domain-containing protein [Bacteroidia bacterium]
MRNNYSFLTRFIYLIGLVFSSTSLLAINETEDNGAFLSSNLFSQNETVNGNIGGSGDANDYFISVPDDDGTINLQINYNSTISTGDFFVYVYNKGGTQIGTNFIYDPGIGEGNDSIIIHCRLRDTLFFRISSTAYFDYDFSYNCIPSGNIDLEPNAGFDEAQSFSISDTIKGRIGYTSVATDVNDYFFTELPTFGTVTYFLEATNTSNSDQADFFSYIYNENGTEIGSSFLYDTGSDGVIYDTITIHCRELDTLFFRISSTSCYSYTFRYEVWAPTQNDVEPNGDFANAVQFNPDEVVEGIIGSVSVSADANDYFFSVLPDDGTLKCNLSYFNTSGSALSDFFVYVYNKGGTQIGNLFKYDQPLGESLDSILIHCRQADTLYFRISSTSCFSYTFNYELIPSGFGDQEPNEDFSSAVEFTPSESVSGRIGYASNSADNNDYFYSTLPEDGTVKYNVTYNNTSGSPQSDFFVYIYNKSGTQIGNLFKYDQPLGESLDSILIYCRQADTLYFRISSTSCFSYNFNYEVIPSGISDLEPNENFASANSIPFNQTTSGRIGYSSISSDANDYFLVVLPESGTLKYTVDYINTSGSDLSDFFVYIYNEAGTQIGNTFNYDVTVGAHSDTVIVPCREADSVFVRISSTSCFSYEFSTQMLNTSEIDSEPNGTSASALPIDLNNILNGQIGHSSALLDANDYFTFTTNEIVSIEANLKYNNTSGSGQSDIFFYLYNAVGTLVWFEYFYDQPIGETLISSAMNCLVAGNYTLRVSSTSCFNYEVEFNTSFQQPRANLDYSRFGNTFGFLSNAFRADSVSWNFDDGTISDLNFPQKEFGIGEYFITLTAFNQTCNIQDIDTVIINVNGIEYYTPKRAGKGGEVGFFNIQLFGGGFNNQTQVELIGNGATLTPFNVASPSGSEANVFFSLQGVEIGIYDVKVILSSGDEYFFPAGFEIFQDKLGFDIVTDVAGPSVLRTNRWTSYTLTVHNDRSRVANGVMACLVLPRNIETNLAEIIEPKSGSYVLKGDEWDRISLDMEDFENTYFQGSLDRLADSVVIDYDSIYAFMDSTLSIEIDSLYGDPLEASVYPIYFPFITSEGSRSIEFKMKSPANGDIKVISYAWPFTFRGNPLSGEALEYIHEGGMQLAALAEYAPNPALRWVGRNAGKIDIGSQIVFAEAVDWWYGTNTADEAFYAKQTLAVGFEVAGNLAPGNGDKARQSANNYKRRIKGETEHLRMTKNLVNPPNKLDPNMARTISDRINQYKNKIDELGGLATEAEKWAAVNDLQNYLAKRGISLGQNEINDLLFGEDPKLNKPKDISEEEWRSITSSDPNAIYGESGFAEQRYIKKDGLLDYMITFENVDTALAPAQIVRVELNLDPQKFDISSFELGNISIAEETYFFRENRSEFYRDIDLRPEKNIIVRVNAQADTLTGNIYWQFTSLEPETGEFLSDPLAGFLPPNVSIPEGEGSVSFSIRLKENIAHNDSIGAQANIFFDENEPILTNIWSNTIDEIAPVASANPQIELSNDSIMKITYSGTDDGSGIKDYYLKVKTNIHGWLAPDFPLNPDGSYEVAGSPGLIYSYYVFAIDSAGNRQSESPVVQASISLIPSDSNIDPDYTIYPNPNQGQLYVRSNGNFADTRVSIYNIYGQRVSNTLSNFIENQEQLYKLPDLSQGVYLIRFENQAGKIITKRFVVSPNDD